MNSHGPRVKKAGMQFGYHTHANRVEKIDGVVVFDELLRRVDPELVQAHLDMAGVIANNVNAADYMAKHPGRFCSLHLKDTGKGQGGSGSLPVGQGDVDWEALFAAVKIAGFRNYSVEMEVRSPVDPLQALKLSAEYLHTLIL